MKKIEEIGFFIQARLASQRVPQKMVRPFAGTTLIDIAVQKILSSYIIPKENFYLSVADQLLIDIGNKYGVHIFHRSQKSIMEEHDIRVLFEWHKELSYKYFVRINPCLPLLSIKTIDKFVQKFTESPHDGMFAVTQRKNYIWSSDGKPMNMYFQGKCFNTKFVEPFFEAAHCLYAGTMNGIDNGVDMGSFQSLYDPEFFVVDEREIFDIDYPWQFDVCEKLYSSSSYVEKKNVD